jgi:hypothetical protein
MVLLPVPLFEIHFKICHMPKLISNEKIEIIRLNAQNCTISQLAVLAKVSHFAVICHLKRLGIKCLTLQEALDLGKTSTWQKKSAETFKAKSKVDEPPSVFKRPPAVYTNRKYVYPEIEAIQ